MLAEKAAQGNAPATEFINNAPELWPWLGPIAAAFYCLSQSRSYAVGMHGASPLPIPFSEVSSYWAAFRPDCELAAFVRLVQGADRAWLSAQKPKTQTKTAPQASKVWVPGRR